MGEEGTKALLFSCAQYQAFILEVLDHELRDLPQWGTVRERILGILAERDLETEIQACVEPLAAPDHLIVLPYEEGSL